MVVLRWCGPNLKNTSLTGLKSVMVVNGLVLDKGFELGLDIPGVNAHFM